MLHECLLVLSQYGKKCICGEFCFDNNLQQITYCQSKVLSCCHLIHDCSCIWFFRPHAAANFYQRALLANALTSALRLHQRLPHFQLSRAFLAQALQEDSCHYLLYSLILVNSYPITSILSLSISKEVGNKGSGGCPSFESILKPFVFCFVFFILSLALTKCHKH